MDAVNRVAKSLVPRLIGNDEIDGHLKAGNRVPQRKSWSGGIGAQNYGKIEVAVLAGVARRP